MVDQHDTCTSETISLLGLWNETKHNFLEIRKNLEFL
jgi:hypothetical protein